jgi:hypothetical protein
MRLAAVASLSQLIEFKDHALLAEISGSHQRSMKVLMGHGI